MKHKFTRTTYRGREVFKFVAKIPRQDSLGIPRSYQKTWRAFVLDPMFEERTIKRLFVAEAKRWYLKIMTQIFGEKAPQVMQQEMINERDDESEQAETMSDLPEGGLVPAGEEPGDLHESPESETKDIQ